MRGKILAIILAFHLIFPTHLLADWLENWFNQYTSSGPDYYQSQRMGYITFGSFSGRLGTTGGPVNLINIEPPRIRIGCGGIDLFLGSIGFTNFEYLVQKAQQLIQAAPIVAFHLALQVLSPTLSNIIQNVENVLNFLNSLQIDECKLLHPILSLDARKIEGATVQERLSDALKKIKKGYESMWEKYKQRYQETVIKKSEYIEKVQEDCPLFVSSIISQGSMIKYLIGRYSLGGSLQLEELARAMIGDFKVRDVSDTEGISVQFDYVQPAIRPDDLKRNRLVRMTEYGTVISTDLDLASRVATILNSAYEAKRNKAFPPDDYINLVKLSPIPVESLLNIAVLTKNPAILIGTAPAVAQGIMYNLLVDIASEASSLISQIPQASNDPQKCPAATQIASHLEKLRDNAWEAADIVSQLYKDTLNEVGVTLNIATRIKDYESIVKSELAKHYNLPLVSRLITQSLTR